MDLKDLSLEASIQQLLPDIQHEIFTFWLGSLSLEEALKNSVLSKKVNDYVHSEPFLKKFYVGVRPVSSTPLQFAQAGVVWRAQIYADLLQAYGREHTLLAYSKRIRAMWRV